MAIIPFDQREGVIWMNGAFVPWKDAKVHVLTHAMHYASAVFEGERAYGGEIFKLTEHTERLFLRPRCSTWKFPSPSVRSTRPAGPRCGGRGSPMPMCGRSRGAARR